MSSGYSPLFSEVVDFTSGVFAPNDTDDTQQGLGLAGRIPDDVNIDFCFDPMQSEFASQQFTSNSLGFTTNGQPNGYYGASDFNMGLPAPKYEQFGPMLGNPALRESTSNEFDRAFSFGTPKVFSQPAEPPASGLSSNDSINNLQKTFSVCQPSLMSLRSSSTLISSQQNSVPILPKESAVCLSMNDILPEQKKNESVLSQQTSSSTLVQQTSSVMADADDAEVQELLDADQDTFFKKCREIAERQGVLGNLGSSKTSLLRDNQLDLDANSDFNGSRIFDPVIMEPKSSNGKKSSGKRERNKNHTPRPSNSFILYRKAKHIEIITSYKGAKALNNNFISKLVAKWWRCESEAVKAYWGKKAEDEKRAHMEKYPDYKYRPKKALMKQASLNSSKMDSRIQMMMSSQNRHMLLPMNHNQPSIAPAPARIAPNYNYILPNSDFQAHFSNYNFNNGDCDQDLRQDPYHMQGNGMAAAAAPTPEEKALLECTSTWQSGMSLV